MRKIVFYSWQSDLPNPINRGLIQDALEKAASAITFDEGVDIEPVIDRDTQGTPGSPDIASTIFAKITAADVFVADISITSRPEKGRPTPNPNVLIELGYAFKALGHERVILIFNQAFGKIEELPFDLRTRRLMTYNLPIEEKDRSGEKKKLESQLNEAIRVAIDSITPVEEVASIPAIEAIENNRPNKIIILRRNLADLLQRILKNQPKKHSAGGKVEELIASIDSSQDSIAEFSKIVEVISIMNDQGSAREIYKWFGSVFEHYNPEVTNGLVSNADGDYFKLIGHEMFVTMIAFYIREQKWDILRKIFVEPIIVKNMKYANGPSNVEWYYASQHLPMLLDKSTKDKRLSVHGDILNARHTTGGLSAIMPIEEFSATDFFLFLLSELSEAEYGEGRFEWRPWSILYLKQVPEFIKKAEKAQYAQHLVEVFQVPSIAEMKKRLKERYSQVQRLFSGGFWHLPKLDTDIDKIASR